MKKIVTYEKLYYNFSESLYYVSRKNKELMKEPYSSALIKDLNNYDFTLNKDIQELLNDTVEELSKLDGYIKDKLNGFPNVLLRTEALSSTQIENYSASNKNIAIAQISKSNNKEANIIKNNLDSLLLGVNNYEINKEMLVELNGLLLNDENVKIRDEINWIGRGNSLPQNADYVPPHPKHLEQYLNEFIKFSNKRDYHPLIHASLIHAYFELIHPFMDGNGRVGRILIQIILKRSNFLENIFVPISLGILKNYDDYIDSLNDFKEGNFETIIEVILNSSLEVTPKIYSVIEELLLLKEKWSNNIKLRKDSFSWTILDELITQPVISVNYLKEKYNVNDQAIRNNILSLENYNVLTKVNNSKRNVLYQSKEVLDIIDKFSV